MKTLNNALPVEFTFAGFSFPKYAWRLPRGPMAKRLANAKNPVTGEYQLRPIPRQAGEASTFFYLDSDFMPGLRWKWCDELGSSKVKHTGWWCDEYQDSKIRGLIMRLPKGRGFLAGWSMGTSMASQVEISTIYSAPEQAALAADSMAENAAEKEREYQEQENARIEAEEEAARLATMAEEKQWEAECALVA